MPKNSSDSVRIFSIDRWKIIGRLKKLAVELVNKDTNVSKVVLFGSLVREDYTPGSDADILVVLKKDKRRKMDRIPDFLIHFLEAGVPVDIFPFTEEELKDNIFLKNALKKKIILAP